MAKFFGLVANEYIKILKKVSTKVMIVLIALAAFALCGVLRFGRSQMGGYSYESETLDYSGEIEWLAETKPEGYEEQTKVYEYINSANISYTDERINIVTAIADRDDIPAGKRTEMLTALLEKDDWRTACSVMEQFTDDAAEKWEYTYRLEHDIPFSDGWQDDVISNIVSAKQSLAYAYGGSDETKEEYENAVKIGLYRLENDISVNAADADMGIGSVYEPEQVNFWFAMFTSSQLLTVVGLLIMIIAGGCIANEYSQGTIKFLLINPVKRYKILMAKYFTVITFGLIMTAALFIAMIPAAGLLLGFDGITSPYLAVSGGEVKELSPLAHAVSLYLLNSVQIAVMATFALAVSSLAKNSALAIGLSVFLMLAGNTIVLVLRQLRQDWARYILFANTDLSAIASGDSPFPAHTLTFAVCVIAVHMLVFILTMWDGFTKREV